jgi:hypothetical protein
MQALYPHGPKMHQAPPKKTGPDGTFKEQLDAFAQRRR